MLGLFRTTRKESLETQIRRGDLSFDIAPDIAFATQGGNGVLLSHGNYYGVDGVALLVWSELNAGSTSARIVQRVCEQYDVAANQAEKDVASLLAEMCSYGFIRVRK